MLVSGIRSFDTDRFRREGRLHLEKGYSLYDYVGAIFSQRDFQPTRFSANAIFSPAMKSGWKKNC